MKSDNPSNDDPIVALCWAWRAKDGNLVFDSVESQIDFKKNNELLIADFYNELARHLVKEKDRYSKVLVGMGGDIINRLGVCQTEPSFPVNYDKKRDSKINF